MSARSKNPTETVARSIARHDGGYLIVTLKGRSAVAPKPFPEGARIVIRDGQAVRAAS